MSGLNEKVNKSVERARAFCPEEGYYLAFSILPGQVSIDEFMEAAEE